MRLKVPDALPTPRGRQIRRQHGPDNHDASMLERPRDKGGPRGGRLKARAMRVRARSLKKPDKTDIEVAQRICAQRIACGLTQVELAQAIGVISSQLHKYERGANRVSMGRLTRIARILRVPVTYLLDGEPRGAPSLVRSRKDQAKFTRMLSPTGAQQLLKAFAKISSHRHELREAIVRVVECVAYENSYGGLD